LNDLREKRFLPNDGFKKPFGRGVAELGTSGIPSGRLPDHYRNQFIGYSSRIK